MERPYIPYPIVVEGKYDKIKIDSLFCADVLVTDGFGVFRRQDKVAFYRKIAERSPILILTDSDGAGTVIRNFFNSILPKDKLIHLYTPAVKGKERRKSAPSKAGRLGVEGIDAVILREILSPYAVSGQSDDITVSEHVRGNITKADMYAWGLSGREGSAERRRELALKLDFPDDISATALLTAMNMLYSRDDIEEML